MESAYALLALFSLLLIASTSVARNDPAEYWRKVTKDEAMPEAIQGLIGSRDSPTKKSDCDHTSTNSARENRKFVNENVREKKAFDEDFEPSPNLSAYDDEKLTENKKDFAKDFEPRPSITAYHDEKLTENKKDFTKDFKPRPSLTAYDDEKLTENKKSFAKDFEPRPNLSAFHDDTGVKEEDNSFVDDFEPRPNILVYYK